MKMPNYYPSNRRKQLHSRSLMAIAVILAVATWLLGCVTFDNPTTANALALVATFTAAFASATAAVVINPSDYRS